MICPGCGLKRESLQTPCFLCGCREDSTEPLPVAFTGFHPYSPIPHVTLGERFLIFKVKRVLRTHIYGAAFDRIQKRSVQLLICPAPSKGMVCSICEQRQTFYRNPTPSAFPRMFDIHHTIRYTVYLYERPPGLSVSEVMRRGGSPRRLFIRLLHFSRDYERLHCAGFICPTLHSDSVMISSTVDRLRIVDISGLRKFKIPPEQTLVLIDQPRFPEDCMGEFGPWSDVYALGCLFKELFQWLIPAVHCWNGSAGVNQLFRFVRDCLQPDPQKRIPNMKVWRSRLCEMLPSSDRCGISW